MLMSELLQNYNSHSRSLIALNITRQLDVSSGDMCWNKQNRTENLGLVS